MATAGIYHTTHASFLREPGGGGGGADPLRPARRSIYPRFLPQRIAGSSYEIEMAFEGAENDAKKAS